MADTNISRALLLALPGAHRHQARMEAIPTDRLVHLFGDLGLAAGAAQVAITRLRQAGIVERMTLDGAPSVRLTDAAARLLDTVQLRLDEYLDDPVVTPRPTLVWHAIPKTMRAERSQFVQELRLHGFGQLQDSTWLALRDRAEVAADTIASLGLGEHCAVLATPPGGADNLRLLVETAWNADEIHAQSQAFIATYRDAQPTSDRDAFITRVRLFEDARGFPSIDPCADASLGGDPALRHEVIAVFRDVFERLRGPAEAYFAAATA